VFIGHFAIALGAKKAAPQLSLGLLFLAAQFLDLLWPTLLLIGIETVGIQPGNTDFTPLNFTSYPYSHSLLMVAGWAVLLGGIYYLITRKGRSATVIAFCVASHWLLDLLTHRPDLPLSPNNQVKVGLGLWNSVPASLIVELLLFAAGLYIFLKTTRAKNKTGVYSFWALIVFLTIIYLSNAFGPPPPSVEAIAWAGQLQWLIVLWAWWADRNRDILVR
jgi:LexA-binding, inner membrane-associated putative hydrolase